MNFRIGDVSTQTGVSTHALRQWEKRYGITPSVVSKGGQRLYSEQDIERVTLIAQLKLQGLRLNELAQLSVSGLRALQPATHEQISVFWADGPSPKLRAQLPGIHWVSDDDSLQFAAQDFHMAIWTQSTITEEFIDSLASDLPTLRCIFYLYASRPHLKQLSDKGFMLEKGEPSLLWLQQQLSTLSERRFFSDIELQQFTRIIPKIECECPNHLAALMQQLNDFALYSLQCQNTTADDVIIHQQLFSHVQHAQLAIERALTLVADAEGL